MKHLLDILFPLDFLQNHKICGNQTTFSSRFIDTLIYLNGGVSQGEEFHLELNQAST